MVGCRWSRVNACFQARMATAQSRFYHATRGWRTVPEDWGIHTLTAVKMALAKCFAIELKFWKDSSERLMDALKFGSTCPSKDPMWGICQSRSRCGNTNEDLEKIAPMKITWNCRIKMRGNRPTTQSQAYGGGRICSHADVCWFISVWKNEIMSKK